MTDTVTLFAELFRGRTDVYGANRGASIPEPVTREHYAHHLNGDTAIGIYNMLDDNTVWFGAIDLDKPEFDVARQMQAWLPGQSWLERSRSGNAHVWVFFTAPAQAWVVRALLKGATEAAGRPEVEVFPKQELLRPGTIGHYINLPLFGDERPILRDLPPDLGEPYGRDAWLSRALTQRQNPQKWEKLARTMEFVPPQERERRSDWGMQPNVHGCAWYIIEGRHERPLAAGHRHVVLFNLAVQLLNWRECTEREARQWVEAVNDAAERPIQERELEALFENAVAGQWTRTGCDDPVMQPYVRPDCPIARGDKIEP